MATSQLSLDLQPVKPETWRPVAGFEGLYEVSDLGRVRSLDRMTRNWRGPIKRKGRILVLCDHSAGYLCVNLSKDGVKAPGTLVHRLVAEAFIPRFSGQMQINHKDFDRTNNAASNLEWCTGSENLHHAANDGRMHRPHATKLTTEDVQAIRDRLATGERHEPIARDFNVNRSVISRIKTGARWGSIR